MLFASNGISSTISTQSDIYVYICGIIIYDKPTRCNSGSIVFINNYKYAIPWPNWDCSPKLAME